MGSCLDLCLFGCFPLHKVVAYMSSLVWSCSGLSEALSEALSMLLAEGLAKTSLNPPVDYSDPWQRIWQKTLERCEFRVWLHPLPTSMNRNLYSGDFFMTHAGSTVTRRTVLSKSSQAIFTVVVSCSNNKNNKRKNSIAIVAVTVNKSTTRIDSKIVIPLSRKPRVLRPGCASHACWKLYRGGSRRSGRRPCGTKVEGAIWGYRDNGRENRNYYIIWITWGYSEHKFEYKTVQHEHAAFLF